jgi:exodeoxyribonuclease V gamma subunit
VARDAIVKMAPLALQPARDALERLVAIWRDGMNRPLPAACKTGLALVQDGDPRATYDGGFEVSGENEDLCLARLWPDFAALSAEPEWADCARELYGPLAEWLNEQITITPITGEDE